MPLTVSSLGFRVWSVGLRVSGLEFMVWSSGFRFWSLGFRVGGCRFRGVISFLLSVCRVWGFGGRAQALKFRVKGLGSGFLCWG